jgi:hypothetical protein
MEAKGKLPPLDGDSLPTAKNRPGQPSQGQSLVAERLGLNVSTISRYLGFLSKDTPDIIREALQEGIIDPPGGPR